MATGKISSINPSMGFAFITPADNSGDIFIYGGGLKAEGFEAKGNDVQVTYEIDQEALQGPGAFKVI